MEKLPMCRLCLAENVRMYLVVNKNLYELYERLTDIPFVTEDSRPILACFFCFAQLKKCYSLRTKYLAAEERFAQIMNEDYEPKPLINQDHLELFHGFIKTPIQSINIVDVSQTGTMLVKEELPIDFQSLEDIIEPKEEHQSDDGSVDFFAPKFIMKQAEDDPRNITESSNERAIKMEVVADVYQQQQQTQEQSQRNKSTETRPSNAERLKRYREKRKADQINACTTFSQSSDVQPQQEQPQHDVQINKRQPQSSAERQRKYRKKLREQRQQQQQMEDINAIKVLSNTSHTSGIHQLQKIDQTPHTSSIDQLQKLGQGKDWNRLGVPVAKKPKLDTGSRKLEDTITPQIKKADPKIIQNTENPTSTPFINTKPRVQNSINNIGEKPYKCDVCQNRFTQKIHLKNHMHKHTGEKPFKCDVCQNRFTQKIHLISHMHIHTGEKPYKCDVCQRTFRQKSTLTKHIAIHTTEKPYKCNICQCNFKTKEYLTGHIQTHTGVKPYKCDVCQQSFTKKCSLKYHIRIHTGEPYKCSICQNNFKTKYGFKNHIC